ncbi:MAG: TraR/DksA C4-type zinc finger protein [Actinomycetota bacterium]|nr:TraR/DksA C4-type zinc finger protein [Actinomycetota bacterium]
MDDRTTRQRLEAERDRLQSLIDGISEREELDASQQESVGSLADYDQHPADAGTETFDRSKDLAIIEQLERELADVDQAMERLEAGTYGRCEVCGKEIDPQRLEAKPAARFCLEDREQAEREADADRQS